MVSSLRDSSGDFASLNFGDTHHGIDLHGGISDGLSIESTTEYLNPKYLTSKTPKTKMPKIQNA